MRMVDSYALEENDRLNDILTMGDKQFNLGLLHLRLLME